MMDYLAHSAKAGFPAQTYQTHIENVLERAQRYAKEAGRYSSKARDILLAAVRNSALLHDLGKLHAKNQAVLRDPRNTASLPINHVDAGTAELLLEHDQYAALNAYAHHRGLPDMSEEEARDEMIFRDNHPSIRRIVDAELNTLLALHSSMVSEVIVNRSDCYNGDQGVLFRMMLSCLSDADHSDTAMHYGQAPRTDAMPQLRASERLSALNHYVSLLGSEDDERSRLRKAMYTSCRDSETDTSFSVCDSPVGSGKTTAIMAHLLRQAEKREARHIFVVLPYTSIITQSVKVYRDALVLPGEKPEDIVAELHSRADFEDYDTRYLTALWRAPIIVTTAVAFFETLAANRPAALRRLHELPGSVIFVDESHNALPTHLLPLAWRWMNVLADEWGCYWVLASGSLVRFWELDRLRDLHMPQPPVHELVEPSLRNALMQYETGRIRFRRKECSLSRSQLEDLAQSLPGPRLLIMNTVQSAAVIAKDICEQYGRGCVEHLSTALTAADREATLKRIKERLANKDDNNWTLVATSCVEAGVDFSFRTGLREYSSLLSLLQAAGRVNRHGHDRDAEIWSFSMQDDSLLKKNPILDDSIGVVKYYFSENTMITPDLSTDALNRELGWNDGCLSTISSLLQEEDEMQFASVADHFHVIESNTVTVIVDDTLCAQIRERKGDWQQLQKHSVSIRRSHIDNRNLIEVAHGIYRWTKQYDPFLGYMRGVLDSVKRITKETLI